MILYDVALVCWAIHAALGRNVCALPAPGCPRTPARCCSQKFEQIWEVVGADELRGYGDVKQLVWKNKDVADPVGWWADRRAGTV